MQVKMDYKLVCIGIFAIFTAYLVSTIPLASAMSVKIYYNGAYQSPAVQYNPQSLVSKTVTVQSGVVVINITNATSAIQIDKVYIYKCRGLSPGECMSTVTPDITNGTFDGSYAWASVTDKTSGYPQRANFVIVVKIISSGKTFWIGFWQTVERTDASTYTPSENQISEMQVHAKDIDDVVSIRNFITNNKMIPFNPQWVVKMVFPIANGIFLLKSSMSGIESQQFTPTSIPQNQITSLDQDYGLAFANVTGTAIFSPVTLNLNPSYNCGNGQCESQLGETASNCCLDCHCQAGSYCDAGGNCRLTSGITLSLQGTPQTTVSNCNEQHILNMTVRINNPPTSTTVSSTKFKLGANPEQTTSCSGGSQTGYIFSCPATVPAVSNCNAGTYKVGPNYLNFSITYPNGNSTASKSISAAFPDITIGSHTCGSNGCESSLGENSQNCCYDCGCPNGYCDVSSPANGSCKQDPASIQASTPSPASFYTHAAGDSVRFFAAIVNSPVTISVQSQSCAIHCARSDAQSCTSSCQLSCSKVSSNSDVYNSSCTMSFTVPSYSSVKSYGLSPSINFSVSYKNGTQTIQKLLTTTVPTINLGSHWCGDRKCDLDETSASCCYDCGCASGYCDTNDTAVFTTGDSCRQTPRIEIDQITTTAFTSSYQEHVINISGIVNGNPTGISLTSTCAYGSPSSFPCYVSCDWNRGGTKCTENATTNIGMCVEDLIIAGSFNCQIAIPTIDYNTSTAFNPQTKKIILSGNSLRLDIAYNNASAKARDNFTFDVPDVVVNVVPQCGDGSGGNGICERGVGESGRTCCADCGCRQEFGTGYFCYDGKNPNGECLSTSNINMRIQSILPNPINCTIFTQGNGCSFTEALKLYASVLKPPSDLTIVDAYYKFGNSAYTPFTCLELGGKGNYSCALALDSINKTNPGAENRTVEIKLTLSYTISGSNALVVKNYSDTASFTVSKVYSQAVTSCMKQQESISKKLADLESDKSLYTILAVIFLILSLIFWAIYIACHYAWITAATCTAWKPFAIISGIIGGCGLAYVLNRLSSIDGKIQELQQQKVAICGASDFEGLSKATSSSGSLLYSIGQIYGGFTCLMGVAGAVGGLSFASTTSTTSTYSSMYLSQSVTPAASSGWSFQSILAGLGLVSSVGGTLNSGKNNAADKEIPVVGSSGPASPKTIPDTGKV